MKKRFMTLMWALLLPLATSVPAAGSFTEGVNYELIKPPQHTSSGDKIEVIELFWYGCPHCHRFQAFVDRWRESMPDNVTYVRMPAILRADWEIHARAFYAAKALGVLDKIHQPLFDAIHNKKQRLFTEQALLDFVAGLGIDREKFAGAMHSFGVNLKVRRAREMGRRFGVRATPTMVVDGKYRVAPGMAEAGFETVLNVVDHLIDKETAAGS